MITLANPINQPVQKAISSAGNSSLGAVLGAIDFVAVMASILGALALGFAALVMVMIELFKLIANLWADSSERWCLIAFGTAAFWVVARIKRLCAF